MSTLPPQASPSLSLVLAAHRALRRDLASFARISEAPPRWAPGSIRRSSRAGRCSPISSASITRARIARYGLEPARTPVTIGRSSPCWRPARTSIITSMT